MKNYTADNKKLKRRNYIGFGIFAGLIITIVIACSTFISHHSFSTAQWEQYPNERTKIVDDLLMRYDLIGMQESEILALLGNHDNDSGYFSSENRFVYRLGMERGFISIDSEWLIIDFDDGIVTGYFITTD